MQRIAYFVCFLLGLFVHATVLAQARELIIGGQNIDYYPHYNFDSEIDKGYASAVLEAFALQYNYQLSYIVLPTERIQKELQKGTIDFAYPDNPRWQRGETSPGQKQYSNAIALAMGGSMVRKDQNTVPLRQVKILAIPNGFSPVKWYDAIEQFNIQVKESENAATALQLVLDGLADAADIEFNVAFHLARFLHPSDNLELNVTHPYNVVEFQLSTVRRPEVLTQLNEFLNNNAALLKQLKHDYGILTPQDVQIRYPTLGTAALNIDN